MIDELVLGMLNNETFKEEHTQFISRRLFNDKLYVDIPSVFTEMSTERIKERYKVDPRPEIIYSDESGKINFSFNMLDEHILDLQFGVYRIRESIKMVYPNTLFYEEEVFENQDNRPGFYFDFRSSSLDGPIYNIIYLVQLTEKTLLGAFNCPFELFMNWKPVVNKVIKSIRT